jgi:hypothetical protein
MMRLAVFCQIRHAAADGVENVLVILFFPAPVRGEVRFQVGVSDADRPGQFPFGGVAVLAYKFSDASCVQFREFNPGLSGYRPQSLGYNGQPDILSDLGEIVLLDDNDHRLLFIDQATHYGIDMVEHNPERAVLPDSLNAVIGKFAINETGIAHIPGSGVNR